MRGVGAPGGGRADGGDERAAGRRAGFGGPGFTAAVAPGGYLWWYVDAVSDDGRFALTLIAFVGSVFSPRYFTARHAARRGGAPADPLAHCAINLHVAGPDGELWVFTERVGADRGEGHFALDGPDGGTRLERRDGALHVTFDERTKPFLQRMPRRISGRIRLDPGPRFDHPVDLDADGRHRWWALAPAARATVELDRPGLRFEGPAYHDCNRGSEGLEDGFRRWHWSRLALPGGAAVLYDTEPRVGPARAVGLMFGADGEVRPLVAPRPWTLRRASWGIERRTRVTEGGAARVERTLVASPFYARSVIHSVFGAHDAVGVHESLDCDRFAARWVRSLLPWRIRSAPRPR